MSYIEPALRRPNKRRHLIVPIVILGLLLGVPAASIAFQFGRTIVYSYSEEGRKAEAVEAAWRRRTVE